MNFIKKINNYLLENYPLVWNTRLVWMLGVAILSHFLFFLIGYFTVSDFIDIQEEYRLSSFYFDSSAVFFNILLCIILLLIWLIYFLQNNAFKNLYILKKGTLFKQFCIIISIVFINITQFYSFDIGLRLKIKTLYSWQEIDADIKEFNKTAIFLIKNSEDYKIEQKQYPSPFPLEKIFTSKKDYENIIDTTKANFYHKGNLYQFYEIDKALLYKDRNKSFSKKKKSVRSNAEVATNSTEAYKSNIRVSDEIYKHDFKYRIVKDVSFYKDDIEECLLNYSSRLYSYGQDEDDDSARLKYYEGLFNRADEAEIKENLQSFLNLAKKYQIRHNLNIEEWYGLLDENNYTYETKLIEETPSLKIYEEQKKVKARKNYIITQFINNTEYIKGGNKNIYFTKKVLTENRVVNERDEYQFHKGKHTYYNKGHKEYSRYKEEYLSNIPYCNLGSLDRFFKNTHETYYPKKYDKEIIYFYIIITLIFGLLLFLFKITDIKSLLLSFVTGAIILIIGGVFIAYIPYSLDYDSDELQLLIAIIIGLSIIITSILAIKLQWKKLITSILFSLALYTVPVILMFIYFLYKESIPYKDRVDNIILETIEDNAFWIIIPIWMISIALYTKMMRKWKGLPE